MGTQAPIYERLSNEPDSAYMHFLYYRNLGPARTLRRAYNAYLIGTGEAPEGTDKSKCGSWGAESVAWNWVERARAFDISILANEGKETVLAFLDALCHAAKRAAEFIRTGQPESWNDALATLNVVGKFIPPEAVEALAAPESDPADEPEPDEEAIGPE